MGQIANQMAFEIFYKVKEKKRNKSGKKAEKRQKKGKINEYIRGNL